MTDDSNALEKRKYTEPEWLQLGIHRQNAVDDAQINYDISQNRIKSVRKPVIVAGGLFFLAMGLSAVGILTLITFLIGGGVAAVTLAYTLFTLKLANEDAGVTKYAGSTRQALKKAQNEFYLWQQVDLADQGEYKKVEIEQPKLEPEVDPITVEIDKLKDTIERQRLNIHHLSKQIGSGPDPKALTSNYIDSKKLLASRITFDQARGEPYLKLNPNQGSLGAEWFIGETQHSKFMYKVNVDCNFTHKSFFLFTCHKHAGHVRAYSIGEFISALEEHDGCKVYIHFLPVEYKEKFMPKPYTRKIPRYGV